MLECLETSNIEEEGEEQEVKRDARAIQSAKNQDHERINESNIFREGREDVAAHIIVALPLLLRGLYDWNLFNINTLRCFQTFVVLAGVHRGPFNL